MVPLPGLEPGRRIRGSVFQGRRVCHVPPQGEWGSPGAACLDAHSPGASYLLMIAYPPWQSASWQDRSLPRSFVGWLTGRQSLALCLIYEPKDALGDSKPLILFRLTPHVAFSREFLN